MIGKLLFVKISLLSPETGESAHDRKRRYEIIRSSLCNCTKNNDRVTSDVNEHSWQMDNCAGVLDALMSGVDTVVEVKTMIDGLNSRDY